MNQIRTIAFRNLFAHRGRTLILGGAIAGVTMLMTLMMALTAGIKTRMIDNATALSTGQVNVGGFLKISQSSAAPIITQFPKIEEVVKAKVPEAKLIVSRVRAFGKIISETNTIMVPIQGINMEAEKSLVGGLALAKKTDYMEGYKLQPGEAPTEGNFLDLAKPGSIAFFASHAKKLRVRVGDTLTVSMPTYRNQYNTKDVKVAAILQNLGMISSFTVFMNDTDVREVYGMKPDASGVVQIYLNSIKDVPAVADRLRKVLPEAGFTLMDHDANPYWMKFERVAGESWTGQRLDVTTWEDETSFLKWVVDIFTALTFALTLTLMVIIVIGLMNNLWMAIRERTSEIGTMRAIGLQRPQVLRMFIWESFFLAMGSVLLGLFLGTVISLGVNALDIPVASEAFVMFLMSNSLWMRIEPANLAITFVVISTLLMIGAFFPAYRASKLKPITAINHVS